VFQARYPSGVSCSSGPRASSARRLLRATRS
jgi:hypothetical protein